MTFRTGVALILSMGVYVSAFAQSAEEKLKAAEQAYAEREIDPAGLAKVQQAIALYDELANDAEAPKNKAFYLGRKSEALNFLGNATEDKTNKIKIHDEGMAAADSAIQAFGISDASKMDDATIENLKKSSPQDLETIAFAIYFKAVNLGQWGQANGVTTSLKRWPELRSLNENVIKLGKRDIAEYGPNRVLGRAYYKIPGIFGGDNKKAKKYLGEAVNKTLATGRNISRNGYNNLYYAEVLKAVGERDAAKALLKEFLRTSAEEAEAHMVPEYRAAQKLAAEL